MVIGIDISNEMYDKVLVRIKQVLNITEKQDTGVDPSRMRVFELNSEQPFLFYGGIRRTGMLTEEERASIYKAHHEDSKSYMNLAREYGVSVSTIRRACADKEASDGR